MRCSRCGEPLSKQEVHCPNCGLQVKRSRMDSILGSGNDTRKTVLFAGIAAVLMIVAAVCVVQEIGRIRQRQAFLKEYNEAAACFDAGDYEDAISALVQLKQQFPREPEVYELLGQAYEGLEMPEEALKAIEEGMSNCSSKKAQQALQNAKSNTYLNMMNQAIDAGETDYADELAQKVLESNPNNSVAKKQLEMTEEKEKEAEEEEEAVQEAEEKEEETRGASGLDAVPLSTIEILPDTIDGGKWDVKRKVQGVEWNTDTMETFYICYASYIVAYNADGSYKTACNDVDGAYLFSIDYYDGMVFSVMRSSSYGKFKLRVYDAETLELMNSTDLLDLHSLYATDNKKYDTKLIPSLDGITAAPAIGDHKQMKIYVSYNVYYSNDDGLALHEDQRIYEYDLDEAVYNTEGIEATRKFKVELNGVKYGIQTLEYDRSTGNIWCAIRQGLRDYSLYCIDGNSNGNKLRLLSNAGAEGWDCPAAGDGLCSLGNDSYYVLIPTYWDDGTSTIIRKVHLDDLESIGQ